MSSRSLTLWLFVAIGLAVLTPAVARADLPRPPGWEPSCTIAKEQSAGSSCEECRGYRNPDPCQEELAKKGYARRCEEGGAGSYVAVWCKDGAPSKSPDVNKNSAGSTSASPPAPSALPPPVAPSADNRRGTGSCGVDAGASELQAEGLAALLAVALGLALLRRTRAS